MNELQYLAEGIFYGSILISLMVFPVLIFMYSMYDDFDGKAFGFLGFLCVKILNKIFRR